MSGNDGTVWHLHIQEDDLGAAVLLRLEGRVYNATSGDLARALDRFCAGDRQAMVFGLVGRRLHQRPGSAPCRSSGRPPAGGDRQLVVFGLCPVVETAFDLSGALAQVTVEPSRETALRRVGLNGS